MRDPIKTDLDLKLIKALTLERLPVEHDEGGKLVYKANPRRLADGSPNPAFVAGYILWDSNRAAPPGFGVRVAGKKTYVLRRKVNGRSLMPTVGNVADFNLLDVARKRAADMALVLFQSRMLEWEEDSVDNRTGTAHGVAPAWEIDEDASGLADGHAGGHGIMEGKHLINHTDRPIRCSTGRQRLQLQLRGKGYWADKRQS